jgi:cystathionine beta-lyase/cystathionine gamma-synthase
MEWGEMNFSEETEMLYKGDQMKELGIKPEVFPLFLTSAFNMGDLTDVQNTYDKKGFTYIRTRNPTRTALGDVVSYLEHGKYSLIFNSGMGAITTTYLAILKPGDHFICNTNIYGETSDTINQLLKNYGVDVDFVDFRNLDLVKKTLKPNTKMIYTEVASNPTDILCDIPALAGIAHSGGAWFMVDNTFTTPVAIKPIDMGADIVINSLTKFMNGHSDTLAGSITTNDEKIFSRVHEIRMLTGTSASPFECWCVLRGLHTVSLRVKKQQDNAAKLALALAKNPHILRVNHPATDTDQKELVSKLFKSPNLATGMLSFEMPNDNEKINEFMNRLHLAHYAPTLGGLRTTLSHPAHSSHFHLSEEEREKIGITYGLMRVSVGIEDSDDLIKDFNQALKVFD